MYGYWNFVWAVLLSVGACATLRAEKCGIQLPGAYCGSIQVPLDYDRPNGTKLDFHFAYITPDVTTGPIPTVILTGGPGLGLIDSLDATVLAGVSVLKRPVLAVDFRGTGRSNVLACRTLRNVSTLYPITSLQSELCITEIGPTTRYYDSVAISRDINMLRRAFKFGKIDLYGVSYGAIILQTYASLFPSTVRAAVLDSPVPLEVDIYGGSIWDAFARIYKVRDGVDGSELLRNLAIILRRLRKSSALRRRIQITPELLAVLYRTTEERLPNALDIAVKTSNYSLLSNITPDSAGPTTPLPNEVFSHAASISISCNDVVRRVPWKRTDPTGVRRRKSKKAISRLPKDTFSPFLPEEAYYTPSINRCSGYPFVQNLTPLLETPKMGVIETLTLYGEEDPFTPIESIPDLEPIYKTRLVIVPNVGHVVLLNNFCSVGLIGEFLATRNVQNLTVCS